MMGKKDKKEKKEMIENYTEKYSQITIENSSIESQLYSDFGVKRGLEIKMGRVYLLD